jgi:hypothetical protein
MCGWFIFFQAPFTSWVIMWARKYTLINFLLQGRTNEYITMSHCIMLWLLYWRTLLLWAMVNSLDAVFYINKLCLSTGPYPIWGATSSSLRDKARGLWNFHPLQDTPIFLTSLGLYFFSMKQFFEIFQDCVALFDHSQCHYTTQVPSFSVAMILWRVAGYSDTNLPRVRVSATSN